MTIISALLLLLPVSFAHAVLVEGSISISGGFIPVDDVWAPVDLADSTGVDFDGTGTVDQATGDFSGSLGSTATMTDFQFLPVLDPNPVNVWVVDGFTFELNSVDVDFQTANFLGLSGTGYIFGNGFDRTRSEWFLTGQTADDVTFSWSSSNNTIIPVPAAVWLFGSGLIGLAGVARRRKAA
ncbi:MAG: VPLPA-CTERM sorting domain-containing protein [Gammaproteobacteria bacterium]|nr:VPLPA-CTERM sorting domain-containing protein [Gammaproteobacteria bacterium]